jgi:lysophospholipase L1-like esterase
MQHSISLIQVVSSLLPLVAAFPHHPACASTSFILAGDSTTAVQSLNGGGWGTGFGLTLLPPSFSENHGHNGRSTATFISSGDWDGVLAAVKNYTASDRVFVTIQFGHNDQKLVDFEAQFQENLRRMVNDVRGAGGTPVGSPCLLGEGEGADDRRSW